MDGSCGTQSLYLSASSLSQNVLVPYLQFRVCMKKRKNCCSDVAVTNVSAVTSHTKAALNPEVQKLPRARIATLLHHRVHHFTDSSLKDVTTEMTGLRNHED